MHKRIMLFINISLYVIILLIMIFMVYMDRTNTIGKILYFFLFMISLTIRRFYLYRKVAFKSLYYLSLLFDMVLIYILSHYDSSGNFTILAVPLALEVLSADIYTAKFRNLFTIILYIYSSVLLYIITYEWLSGIDQLTYFRYQYISGLMLTTVYFIFIYGVVSLIRYIENQNTKIASANEELEVKQVMLEKAYNDLRETQNQLIISEKMAVIGQMVAGIAHDINTPLASIKSNTDTLSLMVDRLDIIDIEAIGAFKKRILSLNKINSTALDRIIEIIRNLKSFAHLDEAELKEVDLNEEINSTLLILNSQIQGKIEIVKNYGDIPLFACYSRQLNQVFMNLLLNSIQAINAKGNRGTIKIDTMIDFKDIIIVFEDNGVGIKTENLDKIFEPGYTTKGVGIGTGLGLSIVYRIIKRHNGDISVSSTFGQGSRFTIKLSYVEEKIS